MVDRGDEATKRAIEFLDKCRQHFSLPFEHLPERTWVEIVRIIGVPGAPVQECHLGCFLVSLNLLSGAYLLNKDLYRFRPGPALPGKGKLLKEVQSIRGHAEKLLKLIGYQPFNFEELTAWDFVKDIYRRQENNIERPVRFEFDLQSIAISLKFAEENIKALPDQRPRLSPAVRDFAYGVAAEYRRFIGLPKATRPEQSPRPGKTKRRDDRYLRVLKVVFHALDADLKLSDDRIYEIARDALQGLKQDHQALEHLGKSHKVVLDTLQDLRHEEEYLKASNALLELRFFHNVF